MTREEAIKEAYGIPVNKKQHEALQILIPELKEKESEYERIRKAIVRLIEDLQQSDKNFDGVELTDMLAWLENHNPSFKQISDGIKWDSGLRTGIELGKKEASKAIETVEKIDKYINEHLANAHDMKDSNPDKKYYHGWDDALGKIAGILQDVYSGEKQKEQDKCPEYCVRSHCIGCSIYEKKKEQKPETKLTGWVAKDRDGEICVYEDYPERDSKGQFWLASGYMSLDEKSFPDLKWENEPVKVEITIRKK